MWCVNCSSVDTEHCFSKNHVTHPLHKFYQEKFSQLEARLSKCPNDWDEIITSRQKVHEMYQNISMFLSSLQSKVQTRININNSITNKVMGYREESKNWLQEPLSDDSSAEELIDGLHQLNQMTSR